MNPPAIHKLSGIKPHPSDGSRRLCGSRIWPGQRAGTGGWLISDRGCLELQLWERICSMWLQTANGWSWKPVKASSLPQLAPTLWWLICHWNSYPQVTSPGGWGFSQLGRWQVRAVGPPKANSGLQERVFFHAGEMPHGLIWLAPKSQSIYSSVPYRLKPSQACSDLRNLDIEIEVHQFGNGGYL